MISFFHGRPRGATPFLSPVSGLVLIACGIPRAITALRPHTFHFDIRFERRFDPTLFTASNGASNPQYSLRYQLRAALRPHNIQIHRRDNQNLDQSLWALKEVASSYVAMKLRKEFMKKESEKAAQFVECLSNMAIESDYYLYTI